MKKIKYFVIIILIVLVVPIIPYEEEVQEGITIVGNRPIVSYIYKYVKENYLKNGPVAQPGVEHPPYKGKAEGSNPSGATTD